MDRAVRGRTRRGLREATRDDYRRMLDQWAIPFFGRMRLTEIEPRDIKRYASSIAADGKAANTVRLALAPVKALLATAAEEGILRSNPSAGVRVVKPADDLPETATVKALTGDELQRLLGAVPDDWLLLVRFLAQTGTRISEALALTWADIDFGDRRVSIRKRLYRGEDRADEDQLRASADQNLHRPRAGPLGGSGLELQSCPRLRFRFLRPYRRGARSLSGLPCRQGSGEAGRGPVGRSPYAPAYVRDISLSARLERQAGADVPGASLASVHALDLCPSPARGLAGTAVRSVALRQPLGRDKRRE